MQATWTATTSRGTTCMVCKARVGSWITATHLNLVTTASQVLCQRRKYFIIEYIVSGPALGPDVDTCL